MVGRDRIEPPTPGLSDPAPVQGEWDLVWGPATSRGPRETFDSNVMYMVRHRRERDRYVVAIRGTNPILLSDWRLGDFWVTATVAWPYAPAASGVALSASTALGLAALQAMQWRPATTTGARLVSLVGRVLGRVLRTGAAAASKLGAPVAELRSMLGPKLVTLIETWQADLVRPNGIEAVRRALADAPVLSRHPSAPSARVVGGKHAAGPGDVARLASVPGGHAPGRHRYRPQQSGGAGAGGRALAARGSRRTARAVGCGPRRPRALLRVRRPHARQRGVRPAIEAALGATHHHVRNMNDIVTHAWQPDELRQIPALYGSRTALFKPVIDTIVATTESLIRRPARRCARGRGSGRERRDTLGGARIHRIGLRAREYAHTSPRNPATPDT